VCMQLHRAAVATATATAATAPAADASSCMAMQQQQPACCAHLGRINAINVQQTLVSTCGAVLQGSQLHRPQQADPGSASGCHSQPCFSQLSVPWTPSTTRLSMASPSASCGATATLPSGSLVSATSSSRCVVWTAWVCVTGAWVGGSGRGGETGAGGRGERERTAGRVLYGAPRCFLPMAAAATAAASSMAAPAVAVAAAAGAGAAGATVVEQAAAAAAVRAIKPAAVSSMSKVAAGAGCSRPSQQHLTAAAGQPRLSCLQHVGHILVLG